MSDHAPPTADAARLARLELLVREAPVGLAIFDRSLRAVEINPALAAMSGRSVGERMGVPLRDVIPALWPLLEPLYQTALEGGTATDVALTGPLREGERIGHWRVSTYPVPLADGEIGVGVVVRDTSEEAHLAQALRTRTNLYAMLARTSRAVSERKSARELYAELCRIAVDVGGFRASWVGVPADGVLRVAAKAGSDDGYIDEILISLDPNDPRSQGPTGRAFRTGEPFVVNDFFASGMTSPWHTLARRVGFAASAAFPLKEGDTVVAVLTVYAGEPDFFAPELVETLQEITPSVAVALDAFARERERQRLEEELRQAQKLEAIGQLAGGIAHDFNNLLSVIRGSLELVLSDLADDHPSRADLAEIGMASDRAASLVRQLLTFSRRQPNEPRDVNVGDLVSATRKLLQRVIGEEIALDVRTADRGVMVRVDPGQVEQILLNLAVNARDAMLTPDHGHPGTGGTLSFGTDVVHLPSDEPGDSPELPAGRYLRLTVRDTGHGMDAATRSRVFEPFFTTKPLGKGTGLGLATVFGIVKQAGGNIVVDSAPNTGTTFTILLPTTVSGDASALPAHRHPPPALPNGGTILVVEDEGTVRTVTRRMLERCGYEVLEARRGSEALALWREHRAHVIAVVTDLRMPEMGGVELAARLREDRPDLPIVYLSGYSDDRDGYATTSRDARLPKPASSGELLEALGRVLRG